METYKFENPKKEVTLLVGVGTPGEVGNPGEVGTPTYSLHDLLSQVIFFSANEQGKTEPGLG